MKYRLFSLIAILSLVLGATPAFAATAPSDIQVSNVISQKVGKAPTCKLLLSYKRPRVGEPTEILWRSKKADYMTGLYTAEKREPRGSLNVVFGHPGLQYFAAAFVGPGGTTVCTMRVDVRERLVTE